MRNALANWKVARLALALVLVTLAAHSAVSAEVTFREAEQFAESLGRNATFEQRQTAIELYTKVLTRTDLATTQKAKALAHRGHMYSELGMAGEARRDLDAVVELVPNDWLAWSMRGEIAFSQGDYATAIDDFSRSMEVAGSRGNITLTMRGDAYFKAGAYENAIEDYLEVVRFHRETGKKLFGRDPGTRAAGLRSTYERLAKAYAELANAPGR